MRGEQAIFNLEIKKKSGLSLNPDIHHSKVFSSVHKYIYIQYIDTYIYAVHRYIHTQYIGT